MKSTLLVVRALDLAKKIRELKVEAQPSPWRVDAIEGPSHAQSRVIGINFEITRGPDDYTTGRIGVFEDPGQADCQLAVLIRNEPVEEVLEGLSEAFLTLLKLTGVTALGNLRWLATAERSEFLKEMVDRLRVVAEEQAEAAQQAKENQRGDKRRETDPHGGVGGGPEEPLVAGDQGPLPGL